MLKRMIKGKYLSKTKENYLRLFYLKKLKISE